MTGGVHVSHVLPLLLLKIILVYRRHAVEYRTLVVIGTSGTADHKQAVFDVNQLAQTPWYSELPGSTPTRTRIADGF